MRRVAERRLSPARYFQSSFRDEGSLGALNRGLKATATITKSLRDSGTAHVILAGPRWQAWRAPSWEEIAAAEANDKAEMQWP